ncbi:MAG: ATP-dependent DNA ligase, partial [Actinomycetota bacterium]
MLLADLVSTSEAVAATRSRLAKVDAIAERLRSASPEEISIVVSYLSGELRQRRTGVGWASLRDLPSPAAVPTLAVAEVDGAFVRAAEASGPGSVAVRREALASVFGRATPQEQRFLVMLAGGELRQGALAGIMVDAVARAAAVDPTAVRRAAMLAGDLPVVAVAAIADGAAGLERFRLQVGRPLQPMLAKTATSVEAAMEQIGDVASVDWKIDGVRIQVHRDGDEVAVFTRTLDPITDRVPEVVEAALALPVHSIVLDGEAIALRPDGRPRPFQETASRAASRGDVDALRRQVPLTPFFFDVLRLDDADLIDLPAAERQAAAEGVVPSHLWVPRLVTADVGEAKAFFADAVGRGHEGVVVKALDAPYEAGRRGGAWLKVKPVHTLDLVVLA